MICLDTNAVIAAIVGRPAIVRMRLESELSNGTIVGVSTIVLFELQFGAARSARPEQNTAAISAFLALGVTPLPFEPEDAQEAGLIRAMLERAGMPIGPYDLLIAGQARRHGATLITANSDEFARVPGLKSEDWSVPK